jgi:hypothetical protein
MIVAAAYGRTLPLNSVDFAQFECPLLGKADVQIRILKIRYTNGRITPGSSRWDGKVLRSR